MFGPSQRRNSPPDRWFVQSEVPGQEILREIAATGRRPTKLEYAEWEEAILHADNANELRALVDLTAQALAAPTTAPIAEACDVFDAVGLAAKATLRPRRHESGGFTDPCREVCRPAQAARWTRRVARFGDAALAPPSDDASSDDSSRDLLRMRLPPLGGGGELVSGFAFVEFRRA